MKTIIRRLNHRNVLFVMVLVACFLLVRCNDFLDVVPRDKVSSDIVFTSYESATTHRSFSCKLRSSTKNKNIGIDY